MIALLAACLWARSIYHTHQLPDIPIEQLIVL
jgi:hypothetical protein